MYILMINIHGLIRGNSLEVGRDADTGGQTRYVLELVTSLSAEERVTRIDLATRLIRDKRVSSDYSRTEEDVTGKAKIIRLSCGGYKYLPKERLWFTLDEYTDRLIAYIRKQPQLPDVVHGHYADAGYVAAQISRTFGIPMIFSAHSLGRNKYAFLQESGLSHDEAVRNYAISTRIDTEEEILAAADLVIASTGFEQRELYGLYENRGIPRYAVIPPGLDLDRFFPFYHYEIPGSEISEEAKQAHIRTVNELRRFHFEPDKPLILSLCRPDARKNINLLIDIYGKDKELNTMANLAIFAGIRQDIAEMGEGESQVLTEMLLAMDKYDLYGKMAIPKFHDTDRDVPELYRIAALKRGVFVSASYLETFGLTFIEASASGLPFVATDRGGPVDIVENCGSGLLADISDEQSLSQTIKQILTDSSTWNSLSESGINQTREIYTWGHHCRAYLDVIESLRYTQIETRASERKSIGKRFDATDRFLIVDIDDTLIGDDEALPPLLEYLESNRSRIGFGVATGRDHESAVSVLQEHGIDHVDMVISSVGTEIYYEGVSSMDRGWSSHIRKNWHPDRVRDVLSRFEELTLQQEPGAQRQFKISFDIRDGADTDVLLPQIHTELTNRKISYHAVFSHGNLLDILPYRASKGHAIRYLSRKWNIPLDHVYTAGNSGNDRDMLSGRMKGIVVANHEPELLDLKRSSRVYYARSGFAAGVLEGLCYWESKE